LVLALLYHASLAAEFVCSPILIAMMLLSSFKDIISTATSNDLTVYKSNIGRNVELNSRSLFLAFITVYIPCPAPVFIQSLTVSAHEYNL
jgi:hypothetical protein